MTRREFLRRTLCAARAATIASVAAPFAHRTIEHAAITSRSSWRLWSWVDDVLHWFD